LTLHKILVLFISPYLRNKTIKEFMPSDNLLDNKQPFLYPCQLWHVQEQLFKYVIGNGRLPKENVKKGEVEKVPKLIISKCFISSKKSVTISSENDRDNFFWVDRIGV